jgi:translation initiation factor eIF-2B subunit delta
MCSNVTSVQKGNFMQIHMIKLSINLVLQVIESYTTPPQNSLPRHLTQHLSPQIEYLVSCRPLSVSMGNAIRWLKVEINDVDPDTPESKAKADLCEAIDNFIREKLIVADQVIAKTAADKIQDGDTILTFAKSSIVQQTLVEAYKNGKRFKVIVVDSRPLFEGKNLARALADLGLDVQYSLTHGVGHVIKEASKVFLGAHAMMSNGRLYSRVGTAIIAMVAKHADVPVIVCCEGIKFTDKVALDSIVQNEVAPPDELVIGDEHKTALTRWQDCPNLQLLNLMYDVTPAEYISMVVTEYGSLPPSSVPVVHRLSTNT